MSTIVQVIRGILLEMTYFQGIGKDLAISLFHTKFLPYHDKTYTLFW